MSKERVFRIERGREAARLIQPQAEAVRSHGLSKENDEQQMCLFKTYLDFSYHKENLTD